MITIDSRENYPLWLYFMAVIKKPSRTFDHQINPFFPSTHIYYTIFCGYNISGGLLEPGCGSVYARVRHYAV